MLYRSGGDHPNETVSGNAQLTLRYLDKSNSNTPLIEDKTVEGDALKSNGSYKAINTLKLENTIEPGTGGISADYTFLDKETTVSPNQTTIKDGDKVTITYYYEKKSASAQLTLRYLDKGNSNTPLIADKTLEGDALKSNGSYKAIETLKSENTIEPGTGGISADYVFLDKETTVSPNQTTIKDGDKVTITYYYQKKETLTVTINWYTLDREPINVPAYTGTIEKGKDFKPTDAQIPSTVTFEEKTLNFDHRDSNEKDRLKEVPNVQSNLTIDVFYKRDKADLVLTVNYIDDTPGTVKTEVRTFNFKEGDTTNVNDYVVEVPQSAFGEAWENYEWIENKIELQNKSVSRNTEIVMDESKTLNFHYQKLEEKTKYKVREWLKMGSSYEQLLMEEKAVTLVKKNGKIVPQNFSRDRTDRPEYKYLGSNLSYNNDPAPTGWSDSIGLSPATSVSFTLEEGKTTAYIDFVYEKEEKSATVILKYVDIDTKNNIINDITKTGDELKENGKFKTIEEIKTTYIILPGDGGIPADYTFLEKETTVSPNKTTIENGDNITITYYYKKKIPAKVILNYVDDTNNESIIETKTLTGDAIKDGNNYKSIEVIKNENKKEIDGYVRKDNIDVEPNKDKIEDGDEITITYHYTKKLQVIVKYLEVGTSSPDLKEPNRFDLLWNETVTIPSCPEEINYNGKNFEYVDTSTGQKTTDAFDIPNVKENMTVTRWYKPKDKVVVTVKYLEEGTTTPDLLTPEVTTIEKGDNVTVRTAPEKIGELDYSRTDPAHDIGEFVLENVQSDTTIIRYYKPKDKVNVVVYYLEKGTNKELLTAWSKTVNKGDNVDVPEAPVISGYTYVETTSTTDTTPRDKAGFTIKNIQTNQEYIRWYEKEKVTVTINWYTLNRKPIKVPAYEGTITKGDTFTPTDAQIPASVTFESKNWSFDHRDGNEKDRLKEVPNVQSNLTIDVFYKLDELKVTVEYRKLPDPTGPKIVETDDVYTVNKGDPVTIKAAPDTIDEYLYDHTTPTHEQGEFTIPNVTEDMKIIRWYREKENYTLTVNYIDDTPGTLEPEVRSYAFTEGEKTNVSEYVVEVAQSAFGLNWLNYEWIKDKIELDGQKVSQNTQIVMDKSKTLNFHYQKLEEKTKFTVREWVKIGKTYEKLMHVEEQVTLLKQNGKIVPQSFIKVRTNRPEYTYLGSNLSYNSDPAPVGWAGSIGLDSAIVVNFTLEEGRITAFVDFVYEKDITKNVIVKYRLEGDYDTPLLPDQEFKVEEGDPVTIPEAPDEIFDYGYSRTEPDRPDYPKEQFTIPSVTEDITIIRWYKEIELQVTVKYIDIETKDEIKESYTLTGIKGKDLILTDNPLPDPIEIEKDGQKFIYRYKNLTSCEPAQNMLDEYTISPLKDNCEVIRWYEVKKYSFTAEYYDDYTGQLLYSSEPTMFYEGNVHTLTGSIAGTYASDTLAGVIFGGDKYKLNTEKAILDGAQHTLASMPAQVTFTDHDIVVQFYYKKSAEYTVRVFTATKVGETIINVEQVSSDTKHTVVGKDNPESAPSAPGGYEFYGSRLTYSDTMPSVLTPQAVASVLTKNQSYIVTLSSEQSIAWLDWVYVTVVDIVTVDGWETTPSLIAKLRSNERDDEEYDVETAIPTSEDLYANIICDGFVLKGTKFIKHTEYAGEISVYRNWKYKEYYEIEELKDKNDNTRGWFEHGTVDLNSGDYWTGDTETKSRYVSYDTYSKSISGITYTYWEPTGASIEKIAESYVINNVLENSPENVPLKDNNYNVTLEYNDGSEALNCDVKKLGLVNNKIHEISYYETEAEAKAAYEDYMAGPGKNDAEFEDLKGKAGSRQGTLIGSFSTNTSSGTRVVLDGGIKRGLEQDEKTKKWYLTDSLSYNPTIPQDAPKIDDKLLYRDDGLYVKITDNGTYPTTGKVIYKTKESAGELKGSYEETTGSGTGNNVEVLTPVVNNTTLTGHNDMSQLIPNAENVIILGREFSISIPHNGEHIDADGYRSKKFNVGGEIADASNQKPNHFADSKWIQFDKVGVIDESGTYHSKGEKFELKPVTQEEFTFTIPEWEPEVWNGEDVTAETFVIAENVGSHETNTQESANTEKENYVATSKVTFKVVGEITDFEVHGTNDPDWMNLSLEKAPNPKDSSIPLGSKGQNINKAYQYALKTGYSAYFDLKVIGYNSNGQRSETVNITPSYYYISRDGKTVEKVNLFYHQSPSQLYVPLSSQPISLEFLVPNQNGMKYKNEFEFTKELTEAAKVYDPQYNYKIPAKVGTSSSITLDESSRLPYVKEIANMLREKYSGITAPPEAQNCIGHWYGTVRIPAQVFVTKEATANGSTQFLKNGYILVVFNRIYTKNGDTEYLEYSKGSLNDGWPEGPSREINLPSGATATVPDGAVVLYETDYRSRDDYGEGGAQTH